MSDTLSFTPLGVIFDVDDTLLNNYPATLKSGLHEQARFYAMKEIGQKYGIQELSDLDEEMNKGLIKRAGEHTIEGAVWQAFYELGIVPDEKIDFSNSLLREIVARKHEFYEPVLAEFGAPIPEASEFVKAVSFMTDGKIAIASGAERSDVMTFLHTTELVNYFRASNIYCRGEYQLAKPSPDPFDLAFRSLGLPEMARARVLAFEDDPKGVESGKRAGLYVCAITTRYTTDELMSYKYQPDMIHSSYIEFAEALGIEL